MTNAEKAGSPGGFGLYHDGGLAPAPGAVRVRDAQPRLLGVHAAIQVDQPCADEPLYVPRDFDADLRTKVTIASQTGGFVLLTGHSSVGKTRALFEAVQAVVPEWWLLHPRDTEALREFAAHPAGRTVGWLDELQDYLDFAGGVPVGQVRELISAGVVLSRRAGPASAASASRCLRTVGWPRHDNRVSRGWTKIGSSDATQEGLHL